jgi:hypothetical protein
MFVTTVQQFVIGRTYDWYQLHIKHCTGYKKDSDNSGAQNPGKQLGT